MTGALHRTDFCIPWSVFNQGWDSQHVCRDFCPGALLLSTVEAREGTGITGITGITGALSES